MTNTKQDKKKYKIRWLGFNGRKQKGLRLEAYEDYVVGFDKNGFEVYFEKADGFWRKEKYKYGKQVYFENSNGVIEKKKYKKGTDICVESYTVEEDGSWYLEKFNKDGLPVYVELSEVRKLFPNPRYRYDYDDCYGVKDFYDFNDYYGFKDYYDDDDDDYYWNGFYDDDKNDKPLTYIIHYWEKHKYDKTGETIYYENSEGRWFRIKKGKMIEFTDGKYYIDGKEATLTDVNKLMK